MSEVQRNKIKKICTTVLLTATVAATSPAMVWAEGVLPARAAANSSSQAISSSEENDGTEKTVVKADNKTTIPFMLVPGLNSAGKEGLFTDISPEGAQKGNSTYQIQVSGKSDDTKITWTSSDESVASVDENGLVTGHKSGHADITATSGDYSQTFGINVLISDDEPYTISNGTLKFDSAKLGNRYLLTIQGDSTIKDTSIVSKGTNEITTLKNSSGGEDYYIGAGSSVTVRANPGTDLTAKFTLEPANAGTVKVKAENPNLAVVTLNAPATLNVSSTKTVYAKNVRAESDFAMKVGESAKLTAKVTPSTSTVLPSWSYDELTDYWKNTTGSSEFAGAVDFDGTTVTARRPGTANFTVTVRTGDGKNATDHLKITVLAADATLFNDVRLTGSFYYEPVYWAVAQGITSGTSRTAFSPSKEVTRGQFITFLWRASGSQDPESAESPFKDVDSSSPYYKAVLWAYENGITGGDSSGNFYPDAKCTRGQIATFLYNYEGKPSVTVANDTFTDVSKNDYIYDAVYWAAQNNITSGSSATTFSPDRTCTRAEAVTFLYRVVNK